MAMDSGRVVEVSSSVTGFVQFIETIDLCDLDCYVFVWKTDGQSRRAYEQRWVIREID